MLSRSANSASSRPLAAGLFAAMVLAIVAFVMTGRRQTPPVERSTRATEQWSKPAAEIAPSLAAVLATRIHAVYRRATVSEILSDLSDRAGLRCAFPRAAGENGLYSIEKRDITIHELVDELAATSGLSVEMRGDTVVCWRMSDDATLNKLSLELKSADRSNRCNAVVALSKLADPRIYPLLFQALADGDRRRQSMEHHGPLSRAREHVYVWTRQRSGARLDDRCPANTLDTCMYGRSDQAPRRFAPRARSGLRRRFSDRSG